MQYKEWLRRWLENYIVPSSKEKTITRYREIIDGHIAPSLGCFELSALKALDVQAYITELLRCGNLKTEKALSSSSVNSIITVIQGSLKAAYMLKLTPEYVGNKLKRPKKKEKEIKCFTKEEQRKMEIAVLADRREKMLGIFICLYTGIRIGELLELKWEDVDFSTGMLSISRSCHDGRGSDGSFSRITEEPKTSSSKRKIPLPISLLSLLHNRKSRSSSGYIIADINGKPLSVRSYQRSFELLLKRLKIEKKGFHSLRHTFATRALECGMDVKTLSEIMGHKSSTVTLNRYVHSMPEHKRAMMDKLGSLMSV